MTRQILSSDRRLASLESGPALRRGAYRTGLIGWPVEHSVSPAMHNAAFESLGLEGRYVLLPTEPQAVAAALTDLVRKGFRGANVTIPHKQAVMPYLDEVTDAAQTIGAVNTIVNENGKLVGLNTDGTGAVKALTDAGITTAGKKIAVIGSGGAARAVVPLAPPT